MLAKNFLRGGTADYIVTGTWSEKAVQAAGLEGSANLLWSGKGTNYSSVPGLAELSYTPGAVYTHITTNETVQGVDFLTDPNLPGDVICDMSSCIASRPFDVNRYAMIYAGAQKNLGPAGCTIVILRKDMLDRVPSGLPPMPVSYTHLDVPVGAYRLLHSSRMLAACRRANDPTTQILKRANLERWSDVLGPKVPTPTAVTMTRSGAFPAMTTSTSSNS